MTVLAIVIGVVLVVCILRYPYLGVVFVVASLPVTDILPSVPFVSSVVPLIGAVTLASSLMTRKKNPGEERSSPFTNVHWLGALLTVWIFVSHPQAAWFGQDRNWVLTFVQLWVLLWLASKLLDTPQKHIVLIWVYALATAVSALFAIQQGSLGEDFDLSLRVSGFAGGANTAARYFVVALVFFNYLRVNTKNRFLQMLTVSGLIITFLGVFFTVSRTGILLLFTALVLLIIMQPGFRYRLQTTVFFIIAWLVLWFLSDTILGLVQSILPAITHGSDTVGLRYALWKAGWRMWQAYPLQGVGVGMYRFELYHYAQDLLAPRYWLLVPHNMYIQMLAETGLVGFILFILLLGKSLRNFLRSTNTGNHEWSSLRDVWLAVFIVMLLGGITKTDQVDKLVWIGMGISTYLHRQMSLKAENITDDELIVNAKKPVPVQGRAYLHRSADQEVIQRQDPGRPG